MTRSCIIIHYPCKYLAELQHIFVNSSIVAAYLLLSNIEPTINCGTGANWWRLTSKSSTIPYWLNLVAECHRLDNIWTANQAGAPKSGGKRGGSGTTASACWYLHNTHQSPTNNWNVNSGDGINIYQLLYRDGQHIRNNTTSASCCCCHIHFLSAQSFVLCLFGLVYAVHWTLDNLRLVCPPRFAIHLNPPPPGTGSPEPCQYVAQIVSGGLLFAIYS